MTRHSKVNRSFSLSSGTLKRLGIGLLTRSFRPPARSWFLRSPHGDALHNELPPLDLAGAEQLDWVIGTPHEPGAEQRLGRHLDALRQQHQVADVHDLRRLLERIG